MAVESGRLVADLILFDGKIVTVDRRSSLAEAVAVLDGKIVAVGGSSAIKPLGGSSTRMVNLKGATVIPGLIDDHVHQVMAGLDQEDLDVKINISRLDSIEAMKAKIRAAAESAPAGQWLVTSGLFRGSIKEGRFPNRHDLDEAAPEHPVYVQDGGKNIIVNSYALQMAGITRDTPDPRDDPEFPEGHIVRDENGEPTGHLIVGAGDLARKRWWERLGLPFRKWDFLTYDVETNARAIKAQMRIFNAAGVTGVRDMGVAADEVDAYVTLVGRGEATVRTDLLLGIPSRYVSTAELIQTLQHYYGPKQGFGNDWLRIGGMKLVASNYGWWNYSRDKLTAFLVEGNRLGWSFAIHGTPCDLGDSIFVLLDALEAANAVRPLAGQRWSYEHGFGLIDPRHYKKLREWEFIIGCNPLLAYFAAGRSLKMHEAMEQVRIAKSAVDLSPLERATREWGLPARSWMEAGFVVTGGTDCPAVAYDLDRPLLGLWSICTQQTMAGQLLPEETVTREQALRMWTINNAYATFEEKRKGSIEPGKLADIVVLSADLLSVPDHEFAQIKVLETIVGGRTVYERAA